MTDPRRKSPRESGSKENNIKRDRQFINQRHREQEPARYCAWCSEKLSNSEQDLCNSCLAHAINQPNAERVMALLRSARPRS